MDYITEDGRGGGLYTSGTSSAMLVNSIFWGNFSNTGEAPHIFEGDLADTTFLYSAIPGGWGDPADNNINLASDPFTRVTLDDDTRFYLKHAGLNGEASDSVCVDAGDDASADAAFELIDADWQNLTTRSDGQGDTTPVDLGRHY